MSPTLIYATYLLATCGGLLSLYALARNKAPSWILYTAAGAISVCIAAFLFRYSLPWDAWADFKNAYWRAGGLVLEAPDKLRDSLAHGVFGFVNLPILAYLFAPFSLLPENAAAALFTVLTLPAVLFAWFQLVRLANLDPPRAAMLLVLFAASGPLLYSIRQANSTHIVLVLLTGALLSLRARRDLLAGVLLGLAALVKLPLLLFGLYFFARRRWRVVFGGGAVCATAAALSLLVFGWDLHLFWYESGIKPYSQSPIGAHNVQSVTGGVLRLAHGEVLLGDWRPRPIEPHLAVLANGLILALLALSAAAMFGPRFAPVPPAQAMEIETLEFLIVLILALVISPVSWAHYYCWMLIPAAFFLSPDAARHPAARAAGLLGVAAVSLPIIRWRPGDPLLAEFNARFIESNMLIGGLVVLTVLVVLRWSVRRADEVGVGATRVTRARA